ncbi:unnamed protein product [Phytophthora lilii]|uniref:Unnamed protein product n=1 Tax=Phytophthora lilii TaxID=2077276 RepID=A0A9W6TFT8_9STRA|nr:unnamed protein product [Phytophthora lilii]
MGSMKGPSSDISACCRVIPEGETAIRLTSGTTPGDEAMSSSSREAELLAKLSSPIIPQDPTLVVATDTMSVVSADQSINLGPMLPEISVQPAEGNGCDANSNDTGRKQTPQANNPDVEAIRSIEFTDETDSRRSWKVIAQHQPIYDSSEFQVATGLGSSHCMFGSLCVRDGKVPNKMIDIQNEDANSESCSQIPFIIGFQFVDWSRLNGMNTFIDVYFITGTSPKDSTEYSRSIGESTTYSSIARLQNPEMNANIELYYMSITVFMLGTIFSSFLFGNVLALLMSWDQQKAQFRNRMDMIKAEMKYYELPEELQHRVRRNYDYLWINVSSQRAYSDMMLLNQPGISKPLKTTIALHLYKDLLNTVPFFAGSDSRFLGKVCLALETAVYLPGDTIIYCDDIGKEMFIVRKGLVEILIPDPKNSEKRIYLRDGNFFGETALVIDVRRTNTVRAVNICDLNVLSKHAFNEIAAEYPEFGERMKRTVIKRQLDNMNIQSPTEKAKVHNQLTLVVEKSLKQRRMSVSLRTIYRAKKLGDKLKEIADRASKPVRRVSRAIVPRQSRIRPSIREDSQRKTSIEPLYAGGSTRDLAQFSTPLSGSSTHNLFSKRPTMTHRKSSGLPRQLTHPGAAPEATGSRRTIDSVSRKLSRTEATFDLIPSALAEITTMVEQIRQTTEILSLRLGATDDLDDEEEDDDFEYDDTYSDDVSLNLRDSPPFPPLTEESEEEMARRESNSIVCIPVEQ